MTTDITNFISIVRKMNGKVKIKHDIDCQANIYKLLHDFGFRKSKLDKKRIYYRRYGTQLTYVRPIQIKEAFHDFLKQTDYTNRPYDVSHHDILEWYYRKSPVKVNSLYDHYLEDILSDPEIHSLRLQTNHVYKHRFEINKLIAKLDELHFIKTFDIINSYSKSTPPLYYKSIGNRNYIVFNHLNFDSRNTDGFDCWLANYPNEKNIGKKKPVDLKSIRLGFRLDEDFSLIDQYFV